MALIKPQFEAGRDKVGKKGLVKDKAIHLEVIKTIIEFCKTIGLNVIGLDFSPITGTTGNIEFLAHITKNKKDKTVEEELVLKIIDKAHKIL